MTAVALTNVAAFDVQELDAETMRDVNGGGSFWVWLAEQVISNFGDLVDGIKDGYNAARS
jgi:hypothetical protein